MSEPGYLRIGALAKRTGVSPELLRAWERRYRLLQPTRSAGGFRLYSDTDERRVRMTTELIGQGMGTAEAAQRALTAIDEDPSPRTPTAGDADLTVSNLVDRLRVATEAMDDDSAHGVVDRLLMLMSIEGVLADVILPFLRQLGERWATGEITVAQEHFAANLIRGRLLGLARDWGAGPGPTVVLACPPGEAHDLGLIVFGIRISRLGWRVIFLGADTPIATIEDVVSSRRPALVVLAVTDPARVAEQEDAIRALAESVTVAVGGPPSMAAVEPLGARTIRLDPLEAAHLVATWGAAEVMGSTSDGLPIL
jgi:DNA-binding transcriptional MerR regulator